MDGDTIEAICELSAYKLMESWSQPEQMQRILDNPYTHGEIKKLVALEKQNGIGYVLNWVKNETTPTLNIESSAFAAPVKKTAMAFTNVPPPLPATLKLGGLLLEGQSRRAIISGVSFAAGETRTVKLQNRTAQIRCREIYADSVVLEVAGRTGLLTLKIGEEKFVP